MKIECTGGKNRLEFYMMAIRVLMAVKSEYMTDVMLRCFAAHLSVGGFTHEACLLLADDLGMTVSNQKQKFYGLEEMGFLKKVSDSPMRFEAIGDYNRIVPGDVEFMIKITMI